MKTQTKLPEHVAIIMDGNGRWARKRHLPRVAGHQQGAERVREIVQAAAELGIKVLTLFAFSTENWARPKEEVNALMRYFEEFLDKELDNLQKNNVRFIAIGRQRPLPENILEKMQNVERLTSSNKGLTLVLAINYGARQEITDAVKQIVENCLQGNLQCDDINEHTVSSFLYTKDLPDPDLLIRTSGEQRISNFLLWQLSYTEFYFTKTLWPDFSRRHFEQAIKQYSLRQRRFGKL
ncbi:MAG: isoprenyl transferase [Candidatus Omnitrophica bacterium]|nr:isoprenyl transferase [Candidatus Omnitrophota bacterium]